MPLWSRVQQRRAGRWLGFFQMGHGDREGDARLASGRNGWALGILTADLVLRETDVPAPSSVRQARGRLQGCSAC